MQLHPGTGRTTGYGTAFVNQVHYSHGSAVYKNVVDGALTFYGLTPNTSHIVYIAAGGKCPGPAGPAFGTTMKVTTDALGGWHGHVHFSLGRSAAWVVKTFNYHLSVSTGSTISSGVAACGVIADDPNIN